MTLITALKQNQQEQNATEAKNLLAKLIQSSQYVGDVYSIGYEFANVQIHDFHRKQVGGIPSLCFLIATRIKADASEIDFQREDSSGILLRVMDASPLPGHAEAERIRVEAAQRVSGESNTNWDEGNSMDATTANLLSFAGVKCRVIGTFFVDWSEKLNKLVLKFGSDLSNYYPNQGLKVYKPNQEALSTIVNFIDPNRIEEIESKARVSVGEVRYASTNRSFQGVSNVEVFLSPVDLLGQKTALFGMTRTGKSNTTKIILQSVFKLRFANDTPRAIGQLVFDPNGEYANENEQDQDSNKNASAIKNVWSPNGKQDDVVTYGLLTHPMDPRRKLMLLNFFDSNSLQEGKQIIDNALAEDETKYIQNFCQVQFFPPDPNDKSAMTRYNRRVLVYRALLAKAGFEIPKGLRPVTQDMFNSKLLELMRKAGEGKKDEEDSEENENKNRDDGEEKPEYISAAKILGQNGPTWDQIVQALETLREFMTTKSYKKFEDWYINKRANASGNSWADADLGRLLKVFEYPNGPRQIGKVRGQHSSGITSDYADDIYKDLAEGRLVIVDQSSGDEAINKSSAERIMIKIFRENQAKFRAGEKNIPEILVYVEEAHNLLPEGSAKDLQNVWVRTAKEGSKYHIGLVYATQEVSSIQRNILKNTANWFIGHLNNTDETKELCKYYDFQDFEASIRRAQDRGFLRMKTLSNVFVVPIQVRRFEI